MFSPAGTKVEKGNFGDILSLSPSRAHLIIWPTFTFPPMFFQCCFEGECEGCFLETFKGWLGPFIGHAIGGWIAAKRRNFLHSGPNVNIGRNEEKQLAD
jgi:hypothetical protein